MARRLPRPLNRRELLYSSDTPAAQLTELGDAYAEHGLVFDAVEFYARARDSEGLKKMHGIAVKEGDAFLLRKIQEAMPELVAANDWAALGTEAARLGKSVYVERAENGGTPPPPPLHEELAIEEAAIAAADAAAAGADGVEESAGDKT